MTEKLCTECGKPTSFGAVTNENGHFCFGLCSTDWARKNLTHHTISGALGEAVAQIKQGQELLFCLESAPGQALVGTSEALYVVNAATFAKSSASGIPYKDLIGYIVPPESVPGVWVPVKFLARNSPPLELRMLLSMEQMLHRVMGLLRERGLSELELVQAEYQAQYREYGSPDELQRDLRVWQARLPTVEAASSPGHGVNCPSRAVLGMLVSFLWAVPLGIVTGLLGAWVTKWVLMNFLGFGAGRESVDTLMGFGSNVLRGLLGPVFALVGAVLALSIFALFSAGPPVLIVVWVGRKLGNRDLRVARILGGFSGGIAAATLLAYLYQPTTAFHWFILAISAIVMGALAANTIVESGAVEGRYCEACERFTQITDLPLCQIVPEKLLEHLKSGRLQHWNSLVEQSAPDGEELLFVKPTLDHCPGCRAGQLLLKAEFWGWFNKEDGSPQVSGDSWLFYQGELGREEAGALFASNQT